MSPDMPECRLNTSTVDDAHGVEWEKWTKVDLQLTSWA
jgi:hypothetical protein